MNKENPGLIISIITIGGIIFNTWFSYYLKRNVDTLKTWRRKKETKNIIIYALDDNPEDLELMELRTFNRIETDNKYELFLQPALFVEKAESGTHIFIIDHFMPGSNGVRIAEKIKQANKNNWVIVFSGAQNAQIFSEYTKQKIDRFVSKNDDDCYKNLKNAIVEGLIIITNR